jgi:hypothetical protein
VDSQAIVDEYFASLPGAMLTLIQFLLLDSISSIYRPLVEERGVVLVYFIMYLFLVSIASMNLLVAIIIESYSEQAKTEAEVDKAYRKEKQQELLPKIASMFEQLDVDDSRTLTKEELFKSSESVRDEMATLMNTKDIDMLFDIIDHSSEGSVSREEFFDGMMRIVLSNVPIQHIQMMKKLEKGEARIENSETRILQEIKMLKAQVNALSR